jgi:hypothetical protein
MPRFFFDLRDEHGALEEDDVGIDLPDFETAYIEAHRTAIDIWAEACREGCNPARSRFESRPAVHRGFERPRQRGSVRGRFWPGSRHRPSGTDRSRSPVGPRRQVHLGTDRARGPLGTQRLRYNLGQIDPGHVRRNPVHAPAPPRSAETYLWTCGVSEWRVGRLVELTRTRSSSFLTSKAALCARNARTQIVACRMRCTTHSTSGRARPPCSTSSGALLRL